LNIFTLEGILKQIKKALSIDRFVALWRVVLLFFSTDYFIQFNPQWQKLNYNLENVDSRTIELLYFIAIWILIWWIVYRLLRLPLRLIFHGKVKSKILNAKKKIEKKGNRETSKDLLEFYSWFSPSIQKFGFKLGFISSNDLNEPLNFDLTEREGGFNEAMLDMYRWLLTLLHTFLVIIVVWQYYSWWLFVILTIIFVVSILLTIIFAVVMLNVEVLEMLRLKLLKENKKNWV